MNRLYAISATFLSPPDRHADRHGYLSFLRRLGRAERASETDYWLLSDLGDEFVENTISAAPQLRDGDFFQVVTPQRFTLRNEGPAVAALMLDAATVGAITLTRHSPTMQRIVLFGSLPQSDPLLRPLPRGAIRSALEQSMPRGLS